MNIYALTFCTMKNSQFMVCSFWTHIFVTTKLGRKQKQGNYFSNKHSLDIVHVIHWYAASACMASTRGVYSLCFVHATTTNQRQCDHGRWPEANVGQQYQ